MNASAVDFEAFVGLPYRDRGRDRDGVDCWGLLRLVYSDRGIELPSFVGAYRNALDAPCVAALIEGQLLPWMEIAEGSERALDAVLMRNGRMLSHVGIVVRPGLVLHVSEGLTSCIENYRASVLRRRVAAFYRLRASAVADE